jgi:diaminohydroxyphosphoribosylaminopyrimidine deaminase/5-amino-6-(5-phosphoribosylamino)uracil reductase
MRRAIELARRAGSATRSNPQVGAVIVHNDRIIGEGYHMKYGESHAEVNAVASVAPKDRALIKSSSIYVSLEPCCFVGKTPACTDLILREGIPRVFVSYVDKTPEVSGHGLEILRKNGVEVHENILEEEGKILAEPRNVLADSKRPYVILKYAESQDGFLSKENSQIWLTSYFSKVLVHKWRSEVDAITVGTNTIKVDNPSLDNRLYFGGSPQRIVLDRKNGLEKNVKVFNNAAQTITLSQGDQKNMDSEDHTFLENFDWEDILNYLGSQNIKTLFVEGGAQLLSNIYKSGLWDETRLLISNKPLNSGIRVQKPTDWHEVQRLNVGKDTLVQIMANR